MIPTSPKLPQQPKTTLALKDKVKPTHKAATQVTLAMSLELLSLSILELSNLLT